MSKETLRKFPECPHDNEHDDWITGEPFCLMSNSHLQNSLKWMNVKGNSKHMDDPSWYEESLIDEIERRKAEKIIILEKF